MRITSASRIVPCGVCKQEFDVDKESYASILATSSSGRSKRAYLHIACYDEKVLAEQYAGYIKEQRANA